MSRDRRRAALIAELARDHRLLVVVIPRGVPTEEIQTLQREVNARLDELVKQRGPIT